MNSTKPKTMQTLTPTDEWWKAIPQVDSVTDLFGHDDRIEAIVAHNPDDLIWLWEAGFEDCIVRMNPFMTGKPLDCALAKEYVGWSFIIFGDACRAIRTLQEVGRDEIR